MSGGEADAAQPDDPVPVLQASTYVYLGLRFSADLTWDTHVLHRATAGDTTPGLLQRVTRSLSALRAHVANYGVLSPRTAMRVLRAQVMSKVQYAAATWAPCPLTSVTSQQRRIRASTMAAPRKPFESTLRAILGVWGTTRTGGQFTGNSDGQI